MALLDRNSQDHYDRDRLIGVSDDADPEVLEIELIHTHLPKLDDLGDVSWNRDTNETSKAPN